MSSIKKYVMTTNFKNCWKDGAKISYPTHLISDDVKNQPQDNETIFVETNEAKTQIIAVFKGKIDCITRSGYKIYFKVHILETIKDFKNMCLDTKPYWKFLQEGNNNSEYKPPFFEKLLNTTDWQYFEHETFKLLKLLGINNVFKFSQQRGEADGFFKFENLAVLYDTTLETDFENKKRTQIDNFYSQLQNGNVVINEQNTLQTFYECQKQVWIITQCNSRIISKYNNILIKEISIKDLIDLYITRLDSQFTTDILENQLRMLGSDE